MRNKTSKYWLAPCLTFCVGCSALAGAKSISDARLLDEAIEAIDDETTTCSVLDDSTEDDRIKDMIKSRRFEVLEVTRLTDEYGDYRQYVLQSNSGDRVLGIIYSDGDACSKYSFGLLSNDW